MISEPGERAVVVYEPLSGPVGPPPLSRAVRALRWLLRRPLNFWLYVLVGIVGAVGGVSENVQVRNASAVVQLRAALSWAVGLIAGVWVIVNTIYVLVAVATLLIGGLARFIAPAIRPIGRAARLAVVSAVVVFVLGGVFGLLLMGWHAL